MIQDPGLVEWCAEVDGSTLISPSVPPQVESSARPVIAFVGAYDTGKTSIIKRILRELALPIPADLAVAADPTTFIVRDVSAREFVLRDTPGLGSGKELHNERAVDAAVDSDFMFIVMTPQLMSAADEAAWSLLSGTAWGAGEGRQAKDWSALIVNRFDTAGADPAHELDHYRALGLRKLSELASSVEALFPAARRLPCFILSADPYGFVGDDAPQDGAYDEGAGWDGVPALLTQIQQISGSAARLRGLRAVRTRSRALISVQRQLARAVPEVRAARSRNALRLHALESHQRDVVRAWQLSETERDEALAAAVGVDVKAAAAPDRSTLVRARLQQILGDWSEAVTDRLRLLTQSAPESVALSEPPRPATASVPDLTDDRSATLRNTLGKLRENEALVKHTAEACRVLAHSVPKLSKVGDFLGPQLIEAALAVAGLTLDLTEPSETDEYVAAEKQGRRYVRIATDAADGGVRDLHAWSDRYSDRLDKLHAQVSADIAEADQTLGSMEQSAARIKEWLKAPPDPD